MTEYANLRATALDAVQTMVGQPRLLARALLAALAALRHEAAPMAVRQADLDRLDALDREAGQ